MPCDMEQGSKVVRCPLPSFPLFLSLPFFLWALEFPDRMEAAKLKTRSQDLSDGGKNQLCVSPSLCFFCHISSLYIPSFSALLGKRKRAMPKIAAAHRSHEAFSQLKRGPSSKSLHPPHRCSQHKPIFLYRSSPSSSSAAEKERTLPPPPPAALD